MTKRPERRRSKDYYTIYKLEVRAGSEPTPNYDFSNILILNIQREMNP